MTALELITLLSQAIYVVIFLAVGYGYLRARTPAHLDMTVFFGILAFVVVESRIATALGLVQPEWFTDTVIAAVVALPYILLRLVDDFTTVPRSIKRGAEILLIASIAALYVLQGPTLPPLYVLLIVAYIAGLSFYCGFRFFRAAVRAEGVTKRRMQAISLGTVLFAVDILAAGIGGQMSDPWKTILAALGQVLGLAAAISWFLGFAPPPILRRAWQAPELRRFLARAASLPRLPTTRDIVRELERGAAAATGSDARIGVWDEDLLKIRFWPPTGEPTDVEPGPLLLRPGIRAAEDAVQRATIARRPRSRRRVPRRESRRDHRDADHRRREEAGRAGPLRRATTDLRRSAMPSCRSSWPTRPRWSSRAGPSSIMPPAFGRARRPRG